MNELLYQLQTGTYIDPTNITVTEYLERWLSTYCEQNVSPKTLRSVYGHVLPSMQRDAVDWLNDFMGQ
jgi:hypothetical protein